MKIVNIEGQNLHIIWTTWGISMNFSGNMWLMIMLKVNRKLPMMYKIISRYCNAFQVNPELQETFQSNLF